MNNTNSGLVSIISPCFNAEAYIQETYEYLKAQTYTNWEWLVTNDCSTDKSGELLDSIKANDERVKVIHLQENKGAANARNTSLDHATGVYCAFLDIDDIWDTHKLEVQVSLHNEKVQFTYHPYNLVEADGKFIKSMEIPKSVKQKDLLKFNPFATSSIMINRDLIEDHKIRFRDMRRRQDYFFWYDCLQFTSQAISCNEVLSSYRLAGETSLSANKKRMAIIQWGLLRDEFHLGIIKRIYYFLCYTWHGISKYLL